MVRFDYGFGIQAVAALAPSSGFYEPGGRPLKLDDLDYLVIHGAHDGDVSEFRGSRQFEFVRCAEGTQRFKAALYVDRANHGRFNADWGDDFPGLLGRLQNSKPLLSAEDQRRIAKAAVSAFLDASLRGSTEHRRMFRDSALASQWLPKACYAARYNDSTFTAICDCSEDFDVSTGADKGTTVEAFGASQWREELIPLRGDGRQENSAVFLRWTNPPDDPPPTPALLRIHLSQDAALGERLKDCSVFRFALAAAEETKQPIKVSVEFADADGDAAKIDVEGGVAPPIHSQFTKIPWAERQFLKPYEIVLRTYEIPLDQIRRRAPTWKPSDLRSITFEFDRTEPAAVYIDDVGFAK
jgi:hypothetical protein